jgi:hypothetical protein
MIVGTLLVGLAALVLWALFMLHDPELARYSFDKSQRILADFQAIGQFTENYRKSSGELPDSNALDEWFKKRQLSEISYSPEHGAPVYMSDSKGGCGGAGEPDDSDFWTVVEDRYVLCYWRGEWFEAYSPQLNRSTLPTSISEYGLGLLGWLLGAALVVVLCVIAGFVGFWHPKRSERLS